MVKFTAHPPGRQDPDTWRQFVELQQVLEDAATAGDITETSGEITIGNLLIQWGAIGGSTPRTLIFPKPYVDAPALFFTPLSGGSGGGFADARVHTLFDRTGAGFKNGMFKVDGADAATVGFWLAIGIPL